MKYFEIIDKNVAAIFQLQWKIGNISDMFLQYSVLSGFIMIIVHFLSFASSIDENIRKWPQTETVSQTGAFTLNWLDWIAKTTLSL